MKNFRKDTYETKNEQWLLGRQMRRLERWGTRTARRLFMYTFTCLVSAQHKCITCLKMKLIKN